MAFADTERDQMIMQLEMFRTGDAPIPLHKAAMALSCNIDDAQNLRNIIALHNAGKAFDVDAAYSTGVMWQGLPQPRLKFDLNPQADGVRHADARALPLGDCSISSIAFDPPFLVRTGAGSLIKERFSSFGSVGEMWACYGDALTEFKRVLRPAGIVAFKCQGQVLSGKQVWSEEKVFAMAEARGYYVLDKLYRLNPRPMDRPGEYTQRHARRNLSAWWVFRK